MDRRDFSALRMREGQFFVVWVEDRRENVVVKLFVCFLEEDVFGWLIMTEQFSLCGKNRYLVQKNVQKTGKSG